jgi:hypothetical protein
MFMNAGFPGRGTNSCAMFFLYPLRTFSCQARLRLRRDCQHTHRLRAISGSSHKRGRSWVHLTHRDHALRGSRSAAALGCNGQPSCCRKHSSACVLAHTRSENDAVLELVSRAGCSRISHLPVAYNILQYQQVERPCCAMLHGHAGRNRSARPGAASSIVAGRNGRCVRELGPRASGWDPYLGSGGGRGASARKIFYPRPRPTSRLDFSISVYTIHTCTVGR